MGRKPGSKNRSKDEIAADKAARQARKAAAPAAGAAASSSAATGPSTGHNSALTQDERVALLLRGVTEIERLQPQMETINSQIRDQRKKLLAHGFDKAEVDFAIRLRKNKPDEEIVRWRKLLQIALFLNHEIGTQPDMVDQAQRLAGVELAKAQGKQAGLEAKVCDPLPQYDPGSPEGQAWIEGWHEGQAINVSMIGKLEPQADADGQGDAFDDAVEDANPAGGKANGADNHQPTAEEIAAGRKDWTDKMRENIASGDQHNREVGQQIVDERAGNQDPGPMPSFLDRTKEPA